MSHNACVGDVFLISIDEARWGIGQVAGAWKGELYIVIFDALFDNDNADPRSVIAAKPMFAALSLDAKIHNGDWPIIGNWTTNLASFPQPVFKVNQGGFIFLESRDRSIFRPASKEEAKILRFRTVVAPVRLEKALKAHNGVGRWDPRYDDLLFDYALESSKYTAS